MAFYTATWVRDLIKQEHNEVQKFISKKGNDFRGYIDTVLPFSLYLDIGNIRNEVLKPSSKFIVDLASVTKIPANDLIKELDNTYIRVINHYQKIFPSITSKELQEKLSNLSQVVASNANIRESLQKNFKNTFYIENISKQNKSVFLIFPRFRTISDRFGKDFKELFDYTKFSDTINDSGDSPRSLIKAFLSSNFGVLQNIGHVEVDIISSNSKEIKRGLTSPRLLQALLEVPRTSNTSNLVKKFSKETGQADTRIVVRKKFDGTKLVLEMLVEAGFMIGSLESQDTNLEKAKKERAFSIGANLTRRMVENPQLLPSLVTSKSIIEYLTESLSNTLIGKKTSTYTSSTTIKKTTKVSYVRPSISIKAPSSNSSKVVLPKEKQVTTYNLSSLQMLINKHLQNVISANMGNGNDRRILNYRTGRLAASAKVERLSESREGMITAFYTYMKNPYATFSEGGIQQYPKTRDPKLLIGNAIKEIAATQVGARLRAVVI